MDEIIWKGRLGHDPELRFSPNGTAVVNLNVARTKRKQVNGQWVDDNTMWKRISAFGSLAENVAATLKKGNEIIVFGELVPNKYTNREGVEVETEELRARDIVVSLRFQSAPGGLAKSSDNNNGQSQPRNNGGGGGQSQPRNNGNGQQGNGNPWQSRNNEADYDEPPF